MYIRCAFLMAQFFNRWFLNPFSLCSKEQRNICIHPSLKQWSALPSSHSIWGSLWARQKLKCSALWLLGAQPTPMTERPDLHFPAQHPWPSPCASPVSTQAVGQFSKLSQLKINPTKRGKKWEGRIAVRPISPWHHRPYSQGSTGVSREGELPFGWSPAVGQLRPVVKPHSPCAAERAGVLTNKHLCAELHCQCLC